MLQAWHTYLFGSFNHSSLGQLSSSIWSHFFDILAVLRVVLLKDELSHQSEDKSALEKDPCRVPGCPCIVAYIFSSIPTSLPVPATEKHPYSIILPPSWFTIEMVLAWWWPVPGCHLAFTPKNSMFVSSDHRILFIIVWEYFRCILANSKQAAMCDHQGLSHLPITD